MFEKKEGVNFLSSKKSKLKVFSLGGLQEIGKNITAFEYGNDIIIVDCGVAFPEDDMLGIDLVIPDFTYLIRNKSKIRGIILTHGHEDHIGATPFLLREIDAPVYGTRLTLGLLDIKLKEHGLLNTTERNCVSAGEKIKLGNFEIEFITVTHSIADAVALAIKTPIGMVIHSGDFKIDYTPIQGQSIDLQRFAELGRDGVLLFLCESTNVERKGYTMSERSVGAVFENIFNETTNSRIMVATFSSNIHRIQQILNSAVKHDRKVAFAGRSMLNVFKTATDLGFINAPENLIIDISEIKKYTDDKIVIITTGSQGEPMSALTRMASRDHRQVEIKHGDKIIISASSIPGNEKSISKVINELFLRGADVIYEGIMETHVSGHARQDEIKLVHALIKPKFLMPIHGEFRHLKQHKDVAVQLGMDKDDVFVMSIGEVLELTAETAKITNPVPSGQVLVDGLGVGDVGNVVLRDRRILSNDGIIIVVISVERDYGTIVAGPDIISRGFVYVKESENLMEDARGVVRAALAKCEAKKITEWSYMKNVIKDTLKEFVWQTTQRSPMILPIIMEIE